MSRIIRYTFNVDELPPDPTEASTLYTEPIAFQEGYYKAKAWEGGQESIVTVKSFGIWTPAEIETALWLDASDESTITKDGDLVSQWNDKSGNNRYVSSNLLNPLPQEV